MPLSLLLGEAGTGPMRSPDGDRALFAEWHARQEVSGREGAPPAPWTSAVLPMLCYHCLTPLSLPSWDLLEAGSTMAPGPGTQEDLESIQPMS